MGREYSPLNRLNQRGLRGSRDFLTPASDDKKCMRLLYINGVTKLPGSEPAGWGLLFITYDYREPPNHYFGGKAALLSF